MYDLLLKASKGGWKTSEFWLGVLGLLLIQFGPAVLTDANQTNASGWAAHVAGPLGIAVVVAVFAWGRSYVKAHVATAAASSIDAMPRTLATPIAGVQAGSGAS